MLVATQAPASVGCASAPSLEDPVDVALFAKGSVAPPLTPSPPKSASRVVMVEPPPLRFEPAPLELDWPDEAVARPVLVYVRAEWAMSSLAFERGAAPLDRDVRALAASFRTLEADVTEPTDDGASFLQRLSVDAVPSVALAGCGTPPHRRVVRSLDRDDLVAALSSCLARQP